MMFDKRKTVKFRYSDWEVAVHENGAQPKGSFWAEEFPQLLQKLENPDNILKHDHRGEVGTFTAGNVKYVVKKFTFQSSRLMFRLSSVFFPSLGEIACRNGLDMASDGINTPRPVLLMQKQNNRMVVNSWLVYRFVDGELLTSKNAEEIVRFVKGMHAAGWVHRDPHPGNFIRTPDGVATLDPIKARQSVSPYLRAYDVVLMEHDMPAAVDIFGKYQLHFWYKLARTGHSILRFFRLTKHGLRRILGIGNND